MLKDKSYIFNIKVAGCSVNWHFFKVQLTFAP
jgi:hypothetical protein